MTNAVLDAIENRVAAGFMPVDVVRGWEGAGKILYFERLQTQRDEFAPRLLARAN